MWGLQQCTECHEGREGLASQQGQRRRNRWIRISGGRRIPRSLDGRRGAHDDRRQLETSNAGDFKICRQMFPLSLKGESAVDVESCFRRGRDLSEMTASLQPHPIYAVWPHLWHAPPIFSFFFFPFLAIGVPFMQSYSWKLFCSVCTCVRIPNTPYSLMPSALVLTRCSLFMQQFIQYGARSIGTWSVRTHCIQPITTHTEISKRSDWLMSTDPVPILMAPYCIIDSDGMGAPFWGRSNFDFWQRLSQ
jgi:hypothetical protein